MCPAEPCPACPGLAAHPVVHDVAGAFLVEEGQVVLDAALQQGCELDHGCRNGVCGACAVEVCAGSESLEAPDDIEADSLERFQLGPNVRLACRMTTRGPLGLKRL